MGDFSVDMEVLLGEKVVFIVVMVIIKCNLVVINE